MIRPGGGAATVALLVSMPLPAHAATEARSSSDAERSLVQPVNDRRAAAGVPALTARADLHTIARDWSFSADLVLASAVATHHRS